MLLPGGPGGSYGNCLVCSWSGFRPAVERLYYELPERERMDNMSGGYFPLKNGDPNRLILLKVSELIDGVCDDMFDDIYTGEDGQFDNSATGGGSLALLRLAARICREEVE